MSNMGAADQFKAVRPMSVQVVRTKAETALVEAFADAEARLPGGDWLRRLRREAIGAFSGLGLPHRRIEEWKYTDLRAALKEAYPLAAGGKTAANARSVADIFAAALPATGTDKNFIEFIDGRGVAHGGAVGREPFLARTLDEPASWLKAEFEREAAVRGDAVTALNTAFFTDGTVLDIPDGVEIDTPIHLLFADGTGNADGQSRAAVFVRNVIRVGKGAKVTLVETHLGNASAARQANAVTQLIAGDKAEVTHLKFVPTTEGSLHIGKCLVTLGAGAIYKPFMMTIGTGLVRNDLLLAFAGEGAELDFGGAFLAGRNGHSDTTLVIDHAVPRCKSRELMKGVLDGEARGIFQGKVIVRPGAQKTDGKQMAQALMLSPNAEFDSKPELEIYADDVVCGHGSTSAELDEDLVFYCRSRGIPPEEAKALLVESFIGEAIDKIEHEALRDAFMGLARQWLLDNRVKAAA
jgi:Fe-S cluster assembly protein SufD